MTLTEPLISIIIPAYNAGPFIGETLDSILEQSYPHWEAIVVDDHSTDNTAAVVKSYRDPRIQYHLAPRHGGRASINRNIGIGQAKGDFITFMDADDAYYPDGLKTLLEPLLENDHLNASMAFPYYCDNELKPLHPSTHLVENATGSFEFSPLYQLSWESICRFSVTLSVCCLMLRRPILAELGPMDENLLSGEDYNYVINLLRLDWERVTIIPASTFKYRQYRGSVTKAPELLLKAVECHIKATEWLFQLPDLPTELKILETFHVYKRLSVLAASLTKLRRSDLAVKVVFSSFKYPKFSPINWIHFFGKETVRILLFPTLQDLVSKLLKTNKKDYFKAMNL